MTSELSMTRLKYTLICFSFHFCFLVFVVFLFVLMMPVLLLAAVISLILLFIMLSSSLYIDASTQSSILASHLLYFLDTCVCHLSLVRPSSLSSLFSFLSCPGYLTKGLPWSLSLCWDFYCRASFQGAFSFFSGNLFLFFSFISTFLRFPLLIFPSTQSFPSRRAF